AGLLLVATLVFGQVRIAQWSAWISSQPTKRVAVIQVDPSFFGSEQKLRERTLAVHEQVDLICWPQLSLGTYSDELTSFCDSQRTELLSRQPPESREATKRLACPPTA